MYHTGPGRTEISCNKTTKEYDKPTQCKLSSAWASWIGFLRGVFLANHLASIDNLTRTPKDRTYAN